MVVKYSADGTYLANWKHRNMLDRFPEGWEPIKAHFDNNVCFYTTGIRRHSGGKWNGNARLSGDCAHYGDGHGEIYCANTKEEKAHCGGGTGMGSYESFKQQRFMCGKVVGETATCTTQVNAKIIDHLCSIIFLTNSTNSHLEKLASVKKNTTNCTNVHANRGVLHLFPQSYPNVQVLPKQPTTVAGFKVGHILPQKTGSGSVKL